MSTARTCIVGLIAAVVGGGLTSAAIASESAERTTYYVATSGDDDSDGRSLDAPLRSMQQCAAVALAGDTCVVRGGVYRETVRPAASGQADAPITFVSYPGERATVSGADAVNDWSPVGATDVPPTLAGTGFASAVAAGRVHRAEVHLDPTLHADQVFVDGGMVNQARWPNSGPNPLTPTFATAKTGTTPASVVDPDQVFPAGFWAGGTIWVNGGSEWMAHTGTVVASAPGEVAFRSPRTDWQPGGCEKFCAKTGNPYYLTGVLGALDAPGEWHYDRLTSSLYLWMPDGADPAGRVQAKQRAFAFDLAQRRHIHVVGINTFAATITTEDVSTDPGSTPPAVGIVLDGIEARYVSHFVEIPTTPLPIVPQSPFAAHILDTGIILSGEDNVLKNSVVTYSAGNGVTVRGERNRVENNLISETDYGGVMNAPVMAVSIVRVETGFGVFDRPDTEVTITRNTLFNTARDGINYVRFPTDGATYNGSGGFPRKLNVSYNDVFNVGLWHQDSGGIYVCCEFDLTGGSIDHNWFHDHLSKSDRHNTSGYPGNGIYLDLGERNIAVNRNVMWNNGTSGFHMNPGNQRVNRGLLAYNNTFGPGQEKSFDSLPGLQPETRFINNIFSGPARQEDGSVWSSNLPPEIDALFADPAHGDFRLREGSPAIDAGDLIDTVTDGFIGTAPDIGAYEAGAVPFTAGCSMPRCRYTMIDDADDSVAYTGAWEGCLTGCDPPVAGRAATRTWGRRAWPYAGTLTAGSAPGAAAHVRFSGTSVALHVKQGRDTGIAAVSIDGGPEALIDTFLPTAPCGAVEQFGSSCLPQPPGAGDQLVYAVRDLPPGDHTITVRVTGTANPRSSGSAVLLDRIMLGDGGAVAPDSWAPGDGAPPPESVGPGIVGQPQWAAKSS